MMGLAKTVWGTEPLVVATFTGTIGSSGLSDHSQVLRVNAQGRFFQQVFVLLQVHEHCMDNTAVGEHIRYLVGFEVFDRGP